LLATGTSGAIQEVSGQPRELNGGSTSGVDHPMDQLRRAPFLEAAPALG